MGRKREHPQALIHIPEDIDTDITKVPYYLTKCGRTLGYNYTAEEFCTDCTTIHNRGGKWRPKMRTSHEVLREGEWDSDTYCGKTIPNWKLAQAKGRPMCKSCARVTVTGGLRSGARTSV